jgi:FtsP/CotA-like multicopper oxidase with cupredoxin domain
VEIPGSLLVLQQGVPADITIHNRLTEPAAIHWHGIELESYSDGVAGWSGAGRRLAPAIQAGDSFVARLTLPRPGTFIYHTHLNDIEQLTSGLYGAIVVLPPGPGFDASRDHLFVGGWDGPSEPPQLLINGDSLPAPPLELAAGVPHRFRFVNIGPAGAYRPVLVRDTTTQQWREVAKDGADLGQPRPGPSRTRLTVGETRDVEWTPAPGRYELRFMWGGKPAVAQPILVR